MTATDPVQQHIDELIKANDVILFMKGTRMFPQCGFSAAVVSILDDLIESYETVNVLADQGIRAGIKVYSDWPTIPQLYIKGEFIGGSDIVRQLYSTGELHKQLGVEVEEVAPPTVTVTAGAAEVLSRAAANERVKSLRFQVSPTFQYGLSFAAQQPGDFAVEAAGLTFLFDRGSAKRADGATIDYQEALGGFRIDNPNEPAKVQLASVHELKAAMEADPDLLVYDVRRDDELLIASIPGTTQLKAENQQEALAGDKDRTIYFLCRTGARSQAAAEMFLQAGFKDVYNVHGGLHAWSAEIDPSIPRY